MGNAAPPRFSNSTPYNIKLSVHADRLEPTLMQKKINFDGSAGGGFKSDNEVNTPSAGNVGAKSKISTNFEAKAEYKRFTNVESKMHYVDPDFAGFMTVNAETTVELGMISKKPTADWHITILIEIDDKTISVHTKDSSMTSHRLMMGYTEDGRLELVALESKSYHALWRAADKVGS